MKFVCYKEFDDPQRQGRQIKDLAALEAEGRGRLQVGARTRRSGTDHA